jgi:hypothetical protein
MITVRLKTMLLFEHFLALIIVVLQAYLHTQKGQIGKLQNSNCDNLQAFRR